MDKEQEDVSAAHRAAGAAAGKVIASVTWVFVCPFVIIWAINHVLDRRVIGYAPLDWLAVAGLFGVLCGIAKCARTPEQKEPE